MLSCPLVMLWNCISTPEGLSEWFADEVRQDGNLWTFSWNGSEQTAHLIFIHQPEAVRFRWDGDAHDLFSGAFRTLRQGIFDSCFECLDIIQGVLAILVDTRITIQTLAPARIVADRSREGLSRSRIDDHGAGGITAVV